MALPLWSQLQKSVDDPETIEDAIVRIVNEHNDDPEAHLGEGQSLQNHKHEPIIDHPQGSVLADKATMTEFAVRTIFESFSGWWREGSVDRYDVPGIYLYIESGDVNNSLITSFPQVPRNFRNSSFDMVFQVLAHLDMSSNNYNLNMGFFAGGSVTAQGFGFIKNGSNFLAVARQSSNVNQSSPISVDLSQDHVYRVFLDAFEQKIYYFIDGEQVAVLDVPGTGWEDDGGPHLWVGQTGSVDGNMRVAELYFSRGLVAP